MVNRRIDSFVENLTEERNKVSFAAFKKKKNFILNIIGVDKKVSDSCYNLDFVSLHCKLTGYVKVEERLRKEGLEKITNKSVFQEFLLNKKEVQNFFFD